MNPSPDSLDKNLRLTIFNLLGELPYLDTTEEIYEFARAIESLSKAIANLRQPFTPSLDVGDRVIPFPSPTPEPETKPKRRRKPGQPRVTKGTKAIAPPADHIRRLIEKPDREPDCPDFVSKVIDTSSENSSLAEMILSLRKEIQSLKESPIPTSVPTPEIEREPDREPEPIAFYSWGDGQIAGKEYYSPSTNTVSGFNPAIPKDNLSEYSGDDYNDSLPETDYPDFWNP